MGEKDGESDLFKYLAEIVKLGCYYHQHGIKKSRILHWDPIIFGKNVPTGIRTRVEGSLRRLQAPQAFGMSTTPSGQQSE